MCFAITAQCILQSLYCYDSHTNQGSDMQNHRTTFDEALEDVRITKLIRACMDVPFDHSKYRRYRLAHAFGAWLSERRQGEHRAEQRA
jgi:hypothetical protein